MIPLLGGHYEAALVRLLPVPDQGELRPHFLLHASRALYGLNRLVDAEYFLRILIAENPDHSEGHRWLGTVYYDLGAFDAGIVELKEVARLIPDDFRPHRLIGLMYHDFEQEEEAAAAYRAALERNPPEPVQREVVRELAESLITLRKFAEAESVIAKVPTDERLHVLLAQCHWHQGHKEEALQQIARAKRTTPDDRALGLLEAEILRTQNDLAGALATLQKAAEKHPHDAETRYHLAIALRAVGRNEDAEAEMKRWKSSKERAVRLTELNRKAVHDPRDPVIREELAALCRELGKHELAEMWERAAASCRAAQKSRH